MSDCIPWQGRIDRAGYGRYGREGYAHRAAYEARHGRGSADGMLVCHTCDNRRCVNPDHLFLGRPIDNIMDMVRKGRHVPTRGERSGMAKLTAEQVLEIRASTESARAIAARMGVSESNIYQVRRRDTWAHL